MYHPPVSGMHTYWPRALLLGANVILPVLTIALRFPWLLMWMDFTVHVALFYAVLAPRCDWLIPLATHFRTEAREAWLTIDDGPDGERTVTLAGELRQRGVRATFFVIGRNLDRHPEAARALLAAGHSLANHTTTHPVVRFWFLRPSPLRAEIDRCNHSLQQAGVTVTRWFRGPLGSKHFLLRSTLLRRNMRYVAWNNRGHDGILCHPETVARRIARNAAPGCIILLHEGRQRSNEAILRSVDTLLAQGYSFVIPADEQLR